MDVPIEAEEFDVVVLGTGVTESVLAAALAKEGLSVLHLESSGSYGDAWTSGGFGEVFGSGNEVERTEETWRPAHGDRVADEEMYPIADRSMSSRTEVEQVYGVEEENVPVLMDLTPRPLLCSGPMVDLLVQSKCGDYLDFKPMSGTYLDLGDDHGGVQQVPSTRSEVFLSELITAPEKRYLMRFLKSCTETEDSVESHEFGGDRQSSDRAPSFESFMESRKLNSRIRDIILHTVLFHHDEDSQLSVKEGVDAVKRFSSSLQRFGTGSALLMTNYGGGEIPQAFCRLCAVSGGVYVLRRGLQAVVVKDGEVSAVLTTRGDRIHTKFVFANAMYDAQRSDDEEHVWRFAGVVKGKALEKTPRALVVVPARTCGNEAAVRLWQMDDSLGVCPEGYSVLYAECIGVHGGSAEDVRNALRRVLGEFWTKRIIQGATFRQRLWRQKENGAVPNSLYWVHDHSVEIDFTSAIDEAKRLFRKCFPEKDSWFDTDASTDDAEETSDRTGTDGTPEGSSTELDRADSTLEGSSTELDRANPPSTSAL